jgi:hypothetical protein
MLKNIQSQGCGVAPVGHHDGIDNAGYERVCRIWSHVAMNAIHSIHLFSKPSMIFIVDCMRRSVDIDLLACI